MTDPTVPPRPSALRTMLDGGGIRLDVIGARKPRFGDVYYRLLDESWPRLLAQFLVAFMAFNLTFALLYYVDATGLVVEKGLDDIPRFWRGFFFSVHTLVTIGYGNIVPNDLYVNIVVVVEAISGVLGFALITGLAFARFARPTARVLFSNVAVVAPFEGTPTIMLRAVNKRHNLILEASARASLLRLTRDDQGGMMRRFFDLELVRGTNPVFALSWTVMHKITPASPFFGMSAEEIEASGDEVIVVISGTDESMAQTIHARTAYTAADLRWNARFVDILGNVENGRRTLDYRRFHDVEPLPAPSPAAADPPAAATAAAPARRSRGREPA